MQLRITNEMMEKKISSSYVFVPVMQDIIKRDNFPIDQREHFWIVGLDPGNRLNFIELVALGDHEQVKMTSTEVFRVALIKNAKKLIFVHNHPTGGLTPSNADKHATLCLIRIAEMIGIDVVDHIIISESDYYSFADDGLLDEIKLSDEYRVLDPTKFEELKSHLKHAGVLQGMAQERLFLAKKMVELDVDGNLIKKITNLDPELV
jgi:DNA repair protein RadC